MLQPLSFTLLVALATSLPAQQAPPPHSPAEARAASALVDARRAGPLAVHSFLERMPKGADLHMHLSGAIYAETFLKDAAEDHLCVDPVKLAFVKNTGVTQSQPSCPESSVPVAVAFSNTPQGQHLYDALVDAFSMRSFVPTPGTNGHDQFFATFARFGGTSKQHFGEWLDEVSTRAAAQNEQYLEIMQTPSFSHAAALGYQFGWPSPPHPVSTAGSSIPEDSAGTSRAELSSLRDKLLAAGLRDDVAADSAEFSEALAARSRIQRCGETGAAPACSVQIRFLFQVLRQFPPQQVFAQTLLAFELASADPNVVGLNFVQPEDAYLAMAEYHRQMLMLDYLHSVYPTVHISLHAGELAPGLVPPAALRFHIREAVDLGHAERIGHGVDVMYETDAAGLLKELATRHVMVEINLTSNDGILGILAPNHPLPAYRAAHVPVALSTDDEGVSRIDLTHEYTRAALDFGLRYNDLKQMARTGIAHTFLPGPDLFQHPDDFTHVVPSCSGQTLGAEPAKPDCLSFLRSSPHAAQQWELEHRFRIFESTQP
jgi:adenosine deaminase